MDKKSFRTKVLIGGLLIVILGMIIFTVSMSSGSRTEPRRVSAAGGDTEAIPFVEEKETLSGETIASGIQELGELVTAEYYYTHAEKFENVKTLFGWEMDVTKTSLLYTVDGMIKAGIDFTAISVEVDDEAKTVKIILPESRIVSSEIDHDSFQLVDEKQGWFNELSSDSVNKTFAHVKEYQEKKAEENGLLKNADENAARMITSFVKTGFDLKDYSIEVNG